MIVNKNASQKLIEQNHHRTINSRLDVDKHYIFARWAYMSADADEHIAPEISFPFFKKGCINHAISLFSPREKKSNEF